MSKIHLVSVFMVVILVCCVACNNNVLTSKSGNNEIDSFSIKTKYCELKFPKKWENDINYSLKDNGQGVEVVFSANEIKLFNISLNCGSGTLMGTMPLNSGDVVVYADSFKLDQQKVAKEDYNKYCSMQEALNCIIDNLETDYGLIKGAYGIEDDNSTFSINTSLVKIQYPNKWKDLVSIKEKKNTIEFRRGKIKLFDLILSKKAKKDLSLLGVYGDTNIYLVLYKINKNDFDEYDYSQLCSMQEDINIILENLLKDRNFKTS